MSETLVVKDTELLVEPGEPTSLVAVDDSETLVLIETSSEILVTPIPEMLLETVELPSVLEDAAPLEVIEVVTAGPQGPPGEEEVPYSKRVDFVGDTIIYRGEAEPGTPESAAAWRVRRLTLGPGDDVTEEWAGGSAAFDKAWTGRAGFAYA